MENIKYTNDGKKVVVLGDLNKNEKIVQEIFIINDQEVPSGENFVVSTLHDQPALSWKEKKLKEMDEYYEKQKNECDRRLNNLRKRYQEQKDKYDAFLEHFKHGLEEEHLKETIVRIFKIMTGKMKWLVKQSYSDSYELIPFEDAIRNKSESVEYGLKLLTIFGRTKGKLNMRLNRYSDGSGGSDNVFLFETKDQALSFIQDEVLKKVSDNQKCNSDQIKCAIEYGFEIPKQFIDEHFDRMTSQYQEYIDKKNQEIDKFKHIIKGFKKGEDRR